MFVVIFPQTHQFIYYLYPLLTPCDILHIFNIIGIQASQLKIIPSHPILCLVLE